LERIDSIRFKRPSALFVVQIMPMTLSAHTDVDMGASGGGAYIEHGGGGRTEIAASMRVFQASKAEGASEVLGDDAFFRRYGTRGPKVVEVGAENERADLLWGVGDTDHQVIALNQVVVAIGAGAIEFRSGLNQFAGTVWFVESGRLQDQSTSSGLADGMPTTAFAHADIEVHVLSIDVDPEACDARATQGASSLAVTERCFAIRTAQVRHLDPFDQFDGAGAIEDVQPGAEPQMSALLVVSFHLEKNMLALH